MTALSVQKQKEAAAAAAPRVARNPFQMMRALMNWDPFQEMEPLVTVQQSFLPDFEVRENKDGYVFKADVPGIKESDLHVTVNGNQLVISGKRDAEERRQDENFYVYERSYGSFTRSFTLPDSANSEQCGADLKDGVLTVSIPKKPEAQPKRVSVNVTKG